MADQQPAAPNSVLVIEDDDHIAQILKFMLQRQGFEVIIASDGATARSHVQRSAPPELVLLDVMLPHVDGFELVRTIRAQAGWEGTPVIMLTAKNQESDIVRALDAGANDYVVKPFQPNELLARIRRYVRPAQ